ncbi:terminase gpA endonuclease subunit [Amaricoccus solimangrovi]|uniref:Terminase n=1 Tax=Amaricoccus solimangrovi TaxID=2589815 RepID=A0A501WZP3_9RHOB|nr:terminase gpA endonuclease subunit [Amaricoccus solimangrovi]TPE52601.1 terminase [Amaricoccus solimangrovi]
MLEDRPLRFRPGAALPPLRSAGEVVRAALPALAPPARISISEAAARRMVEAGGHWVPWRNDVAPYMVEPMDMVGSRRFEALAFAGPARSSKTEALILNPIAHAILAAPRLVHVVHMTQAAAREFSIETVDKLIRRSPELGARAAKGKGADSTFDKRFAAGARLTIGWPVVTQLSARSIPLVLLTDYDRMPADLGGEGSAFALARKRTQSSGSRGMTVAEASPGFPIAREGWKPETPHDAPPCDGILGLYNQGTRARWYWPCPSCEVEFEPAFERLHYPAEGTPAERGAVAYMVCPHCGGVIEHGAKAGLNRRGRWLHETAGGEVAPLGPLTRRAAIVSYWLQGPAAALASWAQIVTRFLEGEAQFEATGDETLLRAAVNLDLGLPYLSRAASAGAGLDEAGLRALAVDRPWRIAPQATRFLTVAVDVQPGRFVAQVEAWGEGLERTVIDRFDIFEPPEGAPDREGRRIDPARRPEDWAALLGLADRSWPVFGGAWRLRPLAIVIDAGGEAGVTPNAYAFWRKARISHPRRFHLVRGKGGARAKRAEVSTPETAHKGKRHVARDVRLIWASTDRLKDEISASLTRGAEGERALLVPKAAPAEIWAEYAAERRDATGRWDKRPGVRRNEALDLSVYALALAIVLGAEKIAWDRPPPWAVLGPGNAFAIVSAPAPDGAAGAGEAPGADEAPPLAEPPPAPGGKAPGRAPGNWKRRPGRRADFSGW